MSETLRQQFRERGEKCGEYNGPLERRTFEEVANPFLDDRRANTVASGLAREGMQPGSTVALMLPTSIGYFSAFFGTLLAGAIPVPIYPPTRPSQLEEHVRRHAGILTNAGIDTLITIPEGQTVARLLRAKVATLRAVRTIDELSHGPRFELSAGG